MAVVTVGAVSAGERFRGTGEGAVSRILHEHRACDAGFDVSRQEGQPGGRLRIRCKGCGQEIVYHASDAGSWGALQDLGLGTQIENGVHEQARAGSGRPGRRALALIAALVLAAALTAVALTWEGDDGSSESSPSNSAEEPSAATLDGQGRPAGAAERPASKLKQATVVLDPRIIPGAGFSIGVAPGWKEGLDGGAIGFARDADAEVRVFYERGILSYPIMLEGLEDLLRHEHPKAWISGAVPFRFGDLSGRKLTAEYRGGREVGVATAGGGYSYFVLARVDRGAARDTARETRAIHASFRPL